MNCKSYKPKHPTKAMIEAYRDGRMSLYTISRALKRDETGIRNELASMGVQIRKVGSKCKR